MREAYHFNPARLADLLDETHFASCWGALNQRRCVLVNWLRKKAHGDSIVLQLADKLEGCQPCNRCNSAACPECFRAFQRLVTSITGLFLRGQPRSDGIVCVSVVPHDGASKPGELASDQHVRNVRRWKEAFGRAGVTWFLGASDWSSNEHAEARYEPHWAHHLVLTLLSALKSGAMLLADRGFDADWIRTFVSEHGAWANIPPKRNRTEPIRFSPHLYRARNLVERFFNKIKQCRRVATRYDKLAANYLAFISSRQSDYGCALMSPRPSWLLQILGIALHRDLATALSERAQMMAERDRAIAERDLAVVERDLAVVKHDEVADRFPALINAALVERAAFLKQRNQAYAEVDDLCRELNHLKAELAREAPSATVSTHQM